MTIMYEWALELRSRSPLRIGDREGYILLDGDGRPMLPGTSLAGACRAYLSAQGVDTSSLFGIASQQGRQQPGRLFFSDSICRTETAKLELRPRTAMDGATRTIKRFFDRITLSEGLVFPIRLALTVDSGTEGEKQLSDVENILSALHKGRIRLGSYKSTGGGRMSILSGQRVHYDCSKEEELQAYINRSKSMEPWTPAALANSDQMIEITIHGQTDSPLLIAGGKPATSKLPDRAPLEIRRGERSVCVIPATSLKGRLRHQVARISRQLKLSERFAEHIFGSAPRENHNGHIGRLFFDDVEIEEPATRAIYPRIAINPLTGGVKNGMLLKEETVTGRFQAALIYHSTDSEEDKACLALLLFALRDLSTHLSTLGSGYGIGRGYIGIKQISLCGNGRFAEIRLEDQKITDDSNWLSDLQAGLDAYCGKERLG
jgi:CRISPR/Cas system CSM-associated protein Csm3 (group 7 of RAMP superfamily)